MTRRTLTNSDIAELLAVEAETAKHVVQRALRKANCSAFLWPEEAAESVDQLKKWVASVKR